MKCSQCKVNAPVYDWGTKGVFCSKVCVIGNLMDVPGDAFENILRHMTLDDIANLRLVDRDSEVKARRYYFERMRIVLRPEIFQKHAAIVPDILHVSEMGNGTLTARLPNVKSAIIFNDEGDTNWEELTNKISIEWLDFTGQPIPNSIGKLRRLNYLDLSHNEIERLPISFTQLTLLRVLIVKSNALWELPDDIGKLKNLEELDASNNQLKVLPESFGDLLSLKILGLRHNRLESLPESFGNISKLTVFDLSFNVGLRGLPTSFFNLRSLSYLNIFGTRINDPRLNEMGIKELHK